jgi:succinate dehydrogenase/fumarate reductase flavoprotein subunit
MAIAVTVVVTILLALSALATYVVSCVSGVKLTADRFFLGVLASAGCAGVTATLSTELLGRVACQYSRCGGEAGMVRLGSNILLWLFLYGAIYLAAAIVIARKQARIRPDSSE